MADERIKVLDDRGTQQVMELLLAHTDSVTAGLEQSYETKYSSVLGHMNSVTQKMNELQDNVNSQMDTMTTTLQSMMDTMTTSLNSINDSITNFQTSVEEKINSLSQDFDNLDTQVNSISQSVTDLSNSVDERFNAIAESNAASQESINALADDVSEIKSAMGDMIVNIENDLETGNFIVYHYDGTILRSKIVDPITDEDIDKIASGELTEEDILNGTEDDEDFDTIDDMEGA
jgi:uncharacterized phage infection (PIP) family protein YhgE